MSRARPRPGPPLWRAPAGRCSLSLMLAAWLLVWGLAGEAAAQTPAPAVTARLLAASPEAATHFADRLRALGDGAVRVVERDAELTLALGDEAFRMALSAPGHGPVLGGGVTTDRVREQVTAGCRCSAIRAGASLAAQLAVLSELMPAARRIGVMLGPHSAWQAPLVAPPGLILDVIAVDPPQRLGPLLRRQLPDWDALLLPTDPILFGPGTARLVLLTSYRQRVPVFGPDADYVHAGSVASAVPNSDDLVRAVRRWVAQWRATGRWQEPGFAGHYHLVINDHVARAYDLSVTPGIRLERTLENTP